MYHLTKGHDVPTLRPAIISLILKGKENWEEIQNKMTQKPQRIPVTVKVMKLLKRRLRKIDWSENKKKLVWAVSCICWNGSFRIHELLSKERHEFDPLTTLLGKDLSVQTFMIQGKPEKAIKIHLKTMKQQRVGNGVKIEIFQNDSFMCPTKAYEGLVKASNLKKDGNMPVFRTEVGDCYTGKDFNRDLIELTKGYLDVGILRSHSFRSGVATEMALLGFSDEEIKRQGRRSSQAFNNYIKLDRVQRINIARSEAKGNKHWHE